MECLRLRIQDIDFGYHQIMIRDGKGQKDRITVLPVQIEERLKTQINRVKIIHEQDLAAGFGSVYLPDALAGKWSKAAFEFKWQYLFPR